MKTTENEIQGLISQIKDWSLQIAALVAMQEQAVAKTATLAQEAYVLCPNPVIAGNKMDEPETPRSPLYIWENIGEGG
jgi:hypothetical protein